MNENACSQSLWIRTRAGHLRLREGFDFEAVISVGTTTRHCGQQARRGISDEEEWTETFVLPHVHQLVCSELDEVLKTDAEDYVAESNRGERQTPQA
jgi:hypothetical protein